MDAIDTSDSTFTSSHCDFPDDLFIVPAFDSPAFLASTFLWSLNYVDILYCHTVSDVEHEFNSYRLSALPASERSERVRGDTAVRYSRQKITSLFPQTVVDTRHQLDYTVRLTSSPPSARAPECWDMTVRNLPVRSARNASRFD